MSKAFLALGGVAAVLVAAPATARHYSNYIECSKTKDGQCVAWHRMSRAKADAYNVGYVFGPSYSYTPYGVLPSDYSSRYHLDPNGRYVYNNGYIYVVDPTTYAIQRVIDVLGS